MATAKQVKEFIEAFLKAEAEVITKKAKPSLEDYNQASDKMYSFIDSEIYGAIGHIRSSPEFDMRDIFESEDVNPRYLFKISKHFSKKTGVFWLAFVGASDPMEGEKYLSNAISVKPFGEELKINGFYIYSDLETDRGGYEWCPLGNTKKDQIIFEKLEKPVETQRYLEPKANSRGSLENYKADI